MLLVHLVHQVGNPLTDSLDIVLFQLFEQSAEQHEDEDDGDHEAAPHEDVQGCVGDGGCVLGVFVVVNDNHVSETDSGYCYEDVVEA